MTDESEFEASPKQLELFSTDELPVDTMQVIRATAIRLSEAEADILALEEGLKEAKQRKKNISEVELPELMNTVGMSDFTLSDGRKVKLSVFYDAKLKNKREAFAYLDANGDNSIIKDTVTLNFERGDHERADKIVEELAEQGVTLKRKEDIHPQTLKAYVKEKIESGADIPMEAFGVYIGNRVTIK